MHAGIVLMDKRKADSESAAYEKELNVQEVLKRWPDWHKQDLSYYMPGLDFIFQSHKDQETIRFSSSLPVCLRRGNCRQDLVFSLGSVT